MKNAVKWTSTALTVDQETNCSQVDVDYSPLVDFDGTFHDQNSTFSDIKHM